MKLYRVLIIFLITINFKVNASVEVISGRYTVSERDLSVKLIGGYLEWNREYRNRDWYFNRVWEPLKINIDSISGNIESIVKANDVYRPVDSSATFFKFGSRRTIRKQVDGSYLWKDRNGNTTSFDANGLAQYSQNLKGIKIYFSYVNGLLSGAYDNNNTQILWVEYDAIKRKIIKVRDYSGREINYSWSTIDENAENIQYKLDSFIDANGHQWMYEYSTSPTRDGKVDLIKVKFPNNQVETITYDYSGRVTSIADENDNKKYFNFDYIKSRKEYYVKKINSEGVVTENWFKRNGELIRKDINGLTILSISTDLRKKYEKDIFNRITTREYDEFNNLIRSTYPNGTSEEYTYDITTGQLKTYKNKNGYTTKYEYDNSGNLIKQIEAYGTISERVTLYTFDQYGQVLTESLVIDEGPQILIKQFFYDNFGNKIKEIDGKGHATHFTYNSHGQVLTALNARNKQWAYKYDNHGNLIEGKSPLNIVTGFEYDELNLLSKIIFPNNSVETKSNSRFGKPISYVSEVGDETQYEYLPNSRLSKISNDNGAEKKYSYDALGRVIKVESESSYFELIYPQNNNYVVGYGHFFTPIEIKYPTYSIKLKYDSIGRVVEESKHYKLNGQDFIEVKKIKYDGLDNIIEVSGEFIKDQKFEYDALNRLVRAYSNNILEQEFEYNNLDLMVSFTDANGNKFKFEYDLNFNLIKEIRPTGQFNTFEYNENNNLTAKIDAEGNKIVLIYDDDDRIIGEQYYDVNQQLKKSVTYTLNNMGLIESYDDGVSSANYTYNLAQQKLTESLTIEGNTFSHSYTYYPNGQKKSFTGNDGIEYKYFYDKEGRLENIVIPNKGNINYSNFKEDRPENISYPQGILKSVLYDGMLNARKILVKDASALTIFDHNYHYNNSGLLERKETMNGVYTYAYDEQQRIISATYPSLPPENWEYDNQGNRIKDNLTLNNSWTYDANNQLLDSVNNKYNYDNNGNQTELMDANSNVISSYIYDESGNVKYVLDENGIKRFEYYYDPYGRRLFKKDLLNNHTSYFYYNDEGLIYEKSYYDQETHYLFEPGDIFETQPVLKKVDGQYFYYLNDDIGTPHKIINENGVVVKASEYSAFGLVNDYILSNEGHDNIRFPGQYFDTETANNYNTYRYYNPLLGRYNQKDPLGILKDYDEYSYVKNNPLTYFDPLGLFSIKFCHTLGKRGILSASACGKLVIKLEGRCINIYLCFSLSGGIGQGTGGTDVKPSIDLQFKPRIKPFIRRLKPILKPLLPYIPRHLLPPPKPPLPDIPKPFLPYIPEPFFPEPEPENGKKSCKSLDYGCSDGFSAGTGGFKLKGGCGVTECYLIDSTCKQCYECFDD